MHSMKRRCQMNDYREPGNRAESAGDGSLTIVQKVACSCLPLGRITWRGTP